MNHLRPFAALAAAAALGAGMGATSTPPVAAAAPATTVVAAKVSPAVARKGAAQVAYGVALNAEARARRAKANTRTIATLHNSANQALYNWGLAVAQAGTTAPVILTNAEADAVGAWSRYAARQARANPKNAAVARLARNAAIHNRNALAQVTPRPTTPTPAPTPGKAPAPPAPKVAPKVEPMVLPATVVASTVCTKVTSQEYTLDYTLAATGGKYTDFGTHLVGAYTHVNGGTQQWTGQRGLSDSDITMDGRGITTAIRHYRALGDYGAARGQSKVNLGTYDSFQRLVRVDCPTRTAPIGAQVTTINPPKAR